MTKRPIIMMPAYSRETQFSLSAALEVTNWFRSQGHDPITLNGFSTLRPAFSRMIQDLKATEDPPHLLVYFGHGLGDSLLGIKPVGNRVVSLRPVVAGGPFDNAGILDGFITYAVACDSLSVLGREVVQKGGVAYFSNETPLYIFQSDLDHNKVPDFIDVYRTIPESLGRGESVERAYQNFVARARMLDDLCVPGSYECEVLSGALRNFGYVGDGNARWI